jgi:hypothetical protein
LLLAVAVAVVAEQTTALLVRVVAVVATRK